MKGKSRQRRQRFYRSARKAVGTTAVVRERDCATLLIALNLSISWIRWSPKSVGDRYVDSEPNSSGGPTVPKAAEYAAINGRPYNLLKH